jgi:hypothetical protein
MLNNCFCGHPCTQSRERAATQATECAGHFDEYQGSRGKGDPSKYDPFGHYPLLGFEVCHRAYCCDAQRRT